MKTSSVLEPKKNAGHAARLGLLAALLIAAGVLFWQKVQLPMRPLSPGGRYGNFPTKKMRRRFRP